MNRHDIELPPLPTGYAPEVAAAMRNYARAAIEHDRRKQGDAAQVLTELVAVIPLEETLKASASCKDLIDYFKGIIADRKRRGGPAPTTPEGD